MQYIDAVYTITVVWFYCWTQHLVASDLDIAAEWAQMCMLQEYCGASMPTHSTYPIPGDQYQLLNVQLLVRHGDRTPLGRLPFEDINWHAKVDREGLSYLDRHYFNREPNTANSGLLTQKGQWQHVQLGQLLREIYVDKLGFLPADYDSQFIDVRSTQIERTFLSAKHFMSGLYPKAQIIHKNATTNTTTNHGYTIRIHQPHWADSMLISEHGCPMIQKHLKAIQQEAPFLQLAQQMNHVYSHMAVRWNLTLLPRQGNRSYGKIFDTADNLSCRACHNHHQVPSSAMGQPPMDPNFIGQACDLSRKTNEYICYRTAETPEHVRLRSGPLLSEFIDAIQNALTKAEPKDNMFFFHKPPGRKVGGTKKVPKFILYSGHDSTVGNFNGIFQTDKYHWPPYAANFIVELWKEKISDQSHIRVMYNGEVIRLKWCKNLTIEGLCPLEDFFEYAASRIPSDLIFECYQDLVAKDKSINITQYQEWVVEKSSMTGQETFI